MIALALRIILKEQFDTALSSLNKLCYPHHVRSWHTLTKYREPSCRAFETMPTCTYALIFIHQYCLCFVKRRIMAILLIYNVIFYFSSVSCHVQSRADGNIDNLVVVQQTLVSESQGR